MATQCEVFGDHSEVKVPSFVVADGLTIEHLESIRANIVCQGVPSENFRRYLLHIMLVVYEADYHPLQDEISLA